MTSIRTADQALVERWKTGDERAATEIVTRNSEAVARFVSSMGERDVDEAVQDTFVRAFGAIHSWRGDASLKTWLLAVARRVVADRARSAVRRRKREDRWGTLWKQRGEEGGYTALDDVIATETEGAVTVAMRSLSEAEREVFMLRLVEGLDYDQIAQVTQRTVAASRVAYSRALTRMREILREGEGLEGGVTSLGPEATITKDAGKGP